MSANEPITAPRPASPPEVKPAPVTGAPAAKAERPPPEVTFDIRDLCVFYGAGQALHDVTLQIHAHQVTAIIGPSGCGKSTFIRTLNRMHELTPGARHTGSIRLMGEDLYGPNIDPTIVRRRVGMVFQKSNPFPTMSIAENVLVGTAAQRRARPGAAPPATGGIPAHGRPVGRGEGHPGPARHQPCPAASSSASASPAPWPCSRKSC